jgi:hypothetical protein
MNLGNDGLKSIYADKYSLSLRRWSWNWCPVDKCVNYLSCLINDNSTKSFVAVTRRRADSEINGRSLHIRRSVSLQQELLKWNILSLTSPSHVLWISKVMTLCRFTTKVQYAFLFFVDDVCPTRHEFLFSHCQHARGRTNITEQLIMQFFMFHVTYSRLGRHVHRRTGLVPLFKEDSPYVQEDFCYHYMTSEFEYSDLQMEVVFRTC